MKNNLNYKDTSLSAYLTTDKPKGKEIIYALFSKDVNAQLNYKQIESELAKDGIDMPLSTICGRCNDLFREQNIKISKVEEGLQHYSYRFPYDPFNEFKLTWKEKFEQIEDMVYEARDKKKYKNITTKSLVLAIEHIKEK